MILIEHYITLWSNKEILKYLEDIWRILQYSYRKIGGIAGCSKPEDLLNKGNLCAKLVRRNNRIVACTLYKQLGDKSRKLIAGGCDGTVEGKKAFYDMCKEDVSQVRRDSWAEVSGAMEHIFLDKLNAVPIPNTTSKKILHDLKHDVLSLDPDGYHYTRNIGGKPYKKILMGNVPEKYRMDFDDDWEITSNKLRNDYADTKNAELDIDMQA